MKIDPKTIKALQDAVADVKQLRLEYEEKTNEREALTKSIDEAIATGDPDDAEFVRRIGESRTRLEMFPNRLKRLEDTFTPAFETLRAALLEVAKVMSRAAGEEYASAKRKLETFLGGLITDNRSGLEECVRITLPNITSIRDSESLANQATTMQVTLEQSDDSMLARAERVLRSLETK